MENSNTYLKGNITAKKRKRIKNAVISVLRYVFLLIIGYVILFQLIYMISYAFRPEEQLYDPSVVWLPRSFTLENFRIAAKALDYLPSLATTVGMLLVSAVIEIVVCAVIAYGLARYKFPEQKIVFFLVLMTILIPPQMLSVASYIQFTKLDFFGILKAVGSVIGKEIRPNIIDTGWVFYLPSLFGVGIRSGFFIFIYRQFFIGLPKELEEAAWIDGAGPVRTFIEIIIPSSGSAVLTVSIFSILWHWNDYYQSAMFLEFKKTLSVSLSSVTTELKNIGQAENPCLQMAACFLYIIPVLVLYAVVQRWFIKSVERSGIVG